MRRRGRTLLGEIAAVGPGVTKFAVGDRVFGFDGPGRTASEQIREAFEYVASGQKIGNVILTLA
jgi:NADPH:quinone reductase-like Zn-dependent oxidoreductase